MYIQKGKESNSLSYQRSLPLRKEAVSINFSRLRETRDSYGYGGGGQNSKIDKAYPKDDGIFLVNLESGKAKLIVSLLEIKKYVPKIAENGVQYFNHTLFSRKGSKNILAIESKTNWKKHYCIYG